MVKRFTDTLKWTNNKWFRNLPPAYKLFWLYLCDMCDNAGIWHEDMEQANFHMGATADKDKALTLFNGRVEVLMNRKGDESKWWLVDFVDFQCGNLSPDCPPHKKIIELLKKHGLYERVRPKKGRRVRSNKTRRVAPTLQEEEEEKEEEEEEEKEGYGKFVRLTKREYTDLCNKYGKSRIDGRIEAMNDWIASNRKGKSPYEDYGAAIKSWLRKKYNVDSVKELEVQHTQESNPQIYHKGAKPWESMSS